MGLVLMGEVQEESKRRLDLLMIHTVCIMPVLGALKCNERLRKEVELIKGQCLRNYRPPKVVLDMD
jgi:hypothetical protein